MQVVLIEAEAWQAADAPLLSFDHRVHTAEDLALDAADTLHIEVRGAGPRYQQACAQVATRYQRLFPRFNASSSAPWFAGVLRAHRALHDRTKPLVRADYEHSIDVWQWVLRLSPMASAALQMAALFHDIERLVSEPDARVEQYATDYVAFKTAHARRGATLMCEALSSLVEPALLSRAADLVARHEQPEDERELQVLNDADALSFFSLNSPGFLAYYGGARTEKKVRYTLARMRSPAARAALSTLRLEPFVDRLVRQLLDAQPA